MKTSIKIKICSMLAIGAILTSLAACSSNPSQKTSCSLPEGPDLERAISAARFDLERH